MFDWVTDIVRDILWSVVYAFLTLMDIAYGLIASVLTVDFTGNDIVWTAWAGICVVAGAFIIFRVTSRFIKAYFDDETEQKTTIHEVLIRLGIVAIVLACFPFFMESFNGLGQAIVNNTSVITGVANDTVPSTSIVSAYLATESGSNTTYTLSQVDISAKLDSGDYKFFSTYSSLFTVGLVAIAASILMIVICLSIAKRAYELVTLLLVSPIPITSMIFKDGDMSGTWIKSVISIYFCNFFQTIILMIVIILSSTSLENYTPWVKIIVLVGGLLFVIGGTESIAKFIGADTSANNTLQQVASLRMAASGLGSAAAAGVIGAATTTGAAGIYGVGKALGGASISQMQSLGGIASASKSANAVTGYMAVAKDMANNNPVTRAGYNMAKSVYGQSASRVEQSSPFQMKQNLANKMNTLNNSPYGGGNNGNQSTNT